LIIGGIFQEQASVLFQPFGCLYVCIGVVMTNNNTEFFFNLLQHAHIHYETGVMTATHKSEAVGIFVKEGTIIHATGFDDKTLLGYLLQDEGIITKAQLEKCLEQSKTENMSLGKVLIENEYITFDVLFATIRKQAVLTIAALMIWPNIQFKFKAVQPNENAIVPVRIHILETIHEAVRRIEKMSIIQRYLPYPALIFERSRLIEPDEVSLTSEEMDILNRVNGNRTITQIIGDSGMAEDKVYRYLLTLLSTGLLSQADEGAA
jgi:hypothetical protein